MDKELIVVKGKVIEQQKSYTPDSGKEIGYEAGAKMVKRHFDENPDDVMAHFMGRNIIEKILAQPGCIGIRIFHGVKEIGIRTIILVGVDEEGKNIIDFTPVNRQGASLKRPGVIVSGNHDCPPYCDSSTDTGTSTSTSTSWY
jgi:hypothetical protein